MITNGKRICDFCGKDESEASRIFPSRNLSAHICNICVCGLQGIMLNEIRDYKKITIQEWQAAQETEHNGSHGALSASSEDFILK